MAVRRSTLRLVRQLLTRVGAETDETVRRITTAWTRAWTELDRAWNDAADATAAAAIAAGGWPSPFQLRRIGDLGYAMQRSRQALQVVSANTGLQVVQGATGVIQVTGSDLPGVIGSQFPATRADEAEERARRRVLPSALDIMIRRTGEQITSTARPLSTDTIDAINRALIQGVAVGDNPTVVARNILTRVKGAFDGGRHRATVIAQTEILDAHREAAADVGDANRDVLAGWRWHSALDRTTCPSCWSMHGTTFEDPGSPGPLDHQCGRCTRVPLVKSWAELGIGLAEPADVWVDAEQKWRALSRDRQDASFGARRAELVRTGAVRWADLATLRENRQWRPSWAPTPVRDLERIATLRRRTA